jgi:hypothetical protein
MSQSRQKSFGWFLGVAGILVAGFSKQIVFPGLERLLGIEFIVGHESIVYFPNGGYAFTNPGAMVRWIGGVAGIGLVFAVTGVLVLIRAHRKSLSCHADSDVA